MCLDCLSSMYGVDGWIGSGQQGWDVSILFIYLSIYLSVCLVKSMYLFNVFQNYMVVCMQFHSRLAWLVGIYLGRQVVSRQQLIAHDIFFFFIILINYMLFSIRRRQSSPTFYNLFSRAAMKQASSCLSYRQNVPVVCKITADKFCRAFLGQMSS